MKRTHSKLWLALLGSGLLAGICSSSVAGDFPGEPGAAASTTTEHQTQHDTAKKEVAHEESTPASNHTTTHVAETAAAPVEKMEKQEAATVVAATPAPVAAAPVVENKQLTPESMTAQKAPMHAPMSTASRPFSIGPGASLAAPMGFGASQGQAFVGMAGTTRNPTSHRVDGALAWGFGLGDPNEYVGATVVFDVDSVNPQDGGFGSDGAMAVSLSRNLPDFSAVSVGVNRFGVWGDATENKASLYAAASKIFLLNPEDPSNPFPLTLNLGLGNGSYRTIHDQNLGKDNAIGYFGSVALGIHPQLSLIVDYTSSVLTSGFSAVPFTSVPLVVSAGLFDLNHQYGPKTTMTASVGYAFTY